MAVLKASLWQQLSPTFSTQQTSLAHVEDLLNIERKTIFEKRFDAWRDMVIITKIRDLCLCPCPIVIRQNSFIILFILQHSEWFVLIRDNFCWRIQNFSHESINWRPIDFFQKCRKLFFILYINYVIDDINGSLRRLVDDSVIYNVHVQ